MSELCADTEKGNVCYAIFWRRTAACLIDYCILGVLYGMLNLSPIVVARSWTSSYAALLNVIAILNVVAILGTLAVALTYPIFECSSLQATPGKLALGIIVTDINGQRASYARALARAVSINISSNVLGIGLLMVIWTAKKQGLHDMIANCLVVRRPAAQ